MNRTSHLHTLQTPILKNPASLWVASSSALLLGALLLMPVQAVKAQTATPAAPEAPSTQPAASAPSTPSAPKYSADEIKKAFGYIDADRDGKISRAEASGFRGVARHFDQADANKDGFLSFEEFENAMNQAK